MLPKNVYIACFKYMVFVFQVDVFWMESMDIRGGQKIKEEPGSLVGKHTHTQGGQVIPEEPGSPVGIHTHTHTHTHT